jgi:hypothetical protein
MIVKCVAPLPNQEQAKKLGVHYRAGKQAFGVVPGEEYVVFAIRILGGEPWIEITDPDAHPGYLFGAPLLLFEFVDSRVSAFWEAGIGTTGELRLAPPSLLRKSYHDHLFEGVQEVVDDFLRVRAQMEHEATVHRRETPPGASPQ